MIRYVDWYGSQGLAAGASGARAVSQGLMRNLRVQWLCGAGALRSNTISLCYQYF